MKTLIRAATVAAIAAAVTFGLAKGAKAETHQAAYSPRAFVMNAAGGVIRCERAATDTEVEFCAGEIEAPAADPAGFDCATAEVTDEFDFCRLPYPTRR